MRIAILSDIHGNSIALDAVLADIVARGGVDEFWLLGDIVALGHDPAGVLERLVQLPAARFIRGNTDRYVAFGDRPPPILADVKADMTLFQQYTEVTATFAWTQGAVTVAGRLEWLAQLPLALKTILPDGTSCLVVHASPDRDDSAGFYHGQGEKEISALLADCSADLVITGHTHQQVNRRIGRWHVVNVGSISNPRSPDLRASYVILETSHEGYTIEHFRVDYDREKVIAILQRQRHPGADLSFATCVA